MPEKYRLNLSDKTFIDVKAKLQDILPNIPPYIIDELAGCFEVMNDNINLVAQDVIYGLTARSIYGVATRDNYTPRDRKYGTYKLYLDIDTNVLDELTGNLDESHKIENYGVFDISDNFLFYDFHLNPKHTCLLYTSPSPRDS